MMKVLHGYIYPGYCITQLYLLGVVAGNLLNFVTYILISWAIVFVQLVLYHPQWGGGSLPDGTNYSHIGIWLA